jgi:hypothetical protein
VISVKGTPRFLIFSVLVLILGLNIWCGINILKLTSQREVIKDDYAHVNNIGNGLLSVDVWKTHLENIVSDQIAHLGSTPKQEADLKFELEKLLKALIIETNELMNEKQKTIRGKIRKVAFKTFVDVKDLNKETPRFAQTLLDEIRKPANLEKLKELALSQLNSITAPTRDNARDGPSAQAILDKYQVKNPEDFTATVSKLLNDTQAKIHRNTAIMIGSLLLFILAWWLERKNTGLHKPLFALSVTLAIILLISSLSLPMIDIDARVKNVDFLLMGEHMQFSNQLLFYRSKSIMQMVKILIVSGKPDSVFVGLLIFIFSIVFPIFKLLSALLTLFGVPKLKDNKVIHFFAFNSGKWSMADVMVVAIFMAYIGFNGILNSQLKNLNVNSQSLQAIATNDTSLQPGFILFVSFVLFGLVLSEILKRIARPTPV